MNPTQAAIFIKEYKTCGDMISISDPTKKFIDGNYGDFPYLIAHIIVREMTITESPKDIEASLDFVRSYTYLSMTNTSFKALKDYFNNPMQDAVCDLVKLRYAMRHHDLPTIQYMFNRSSVLLSPAISVWRSSITQARPIYTMLVMKQDALKSVAIALKNGVIDVVAQAAYDDAIAHNLQSDPTVIDLGILLKTDNAKVRAGDVSESQRRFSQTSSQDLFRPTGNTRRSSLPTSLPAAASEPTTTTTPTTTSQDDSSASISHRRLSEPTKPANAYTSFLQNNPPPVRSSLILTTNKTTNQTNIPPSKTTNQTKIQSNHNPAPVLPNLPIKYQQLLEKGIHKQAVINQMFRDDMSSTIIEEFSLQYNVKVTVKSPSSSQQHKQDQKNNQNINHKFMVYDRMLKLGIPMQAVLNKMLIAKMSNNDKILFTKKHGYTHPSQIDPLLRYHQMLLTSVPHAVIFSNMKNDGISSQLMNQFAKTHNIPFPPPPSYGSSSALGGGGGGTSQKRSAKLDFPLLFVCRFISNSNTNQPPRQGTLPNLTADMDMLLTSLLPNQSQYEYTLKAVPISSVPPLPPVPEPAPEPFASGRRSSRRTWKSSSLSSPPQRPPHTVEHSKVTIMVYAPQLEDAIIDTWSICCTKNSCGRSGKHQTSLETALSSYLPCVRRAAKRAIRKRRRAARSVAVYLARSLVQRIRAIVEAFGDKPESIFVVLHVHDKKLVDWLQRIVVAVAPPESIVFEASSLDVQMIRTYTPSRIPPEITNFTHESHWGIDSHVDPTKMRRPIQQQHQLSQGNRSFHQTWSEAKTSKLDRLLAAENIKLTLLSNIDKVLQRGENLDELIDKADDLTANSQKFYRKAKKSGGLMSGVKLPSNSWNKHRLFSKQSHDDLESLEMVDSWGGDSRARTYRNDGTLRRGSAAPPAPRVPAPSSNETRNILLHPQDDEINTQNEEQLRRLQEMIVETKNISLNIGQELREQNQLIESIDESVDSFGPTSKKKKKGAAMSMLEKKSKKDKKDVNLLDSIKSKSKSSLKKVPAPAPKLHTRTSSPTSLLDQKLATALSHRRAMVVDDDDDGDDDWDDDESSFVPPPAAPQPPPLPPPGGQPPPPPPPPSAPSAPPPPHLRPVAFLWNFLVEPEEAEYHHRVQQHLADDAKSKNNLRHQFNSSSNNQYHPQHHHHHHRQWCPLLLLLLNNDEVLIIYHPLMIFFLRP